jgi:hypothetical protein
MVGARRGIVYHDLVRLWELSIAGAAFLVLCTVLLYLFGSEVRMRIPYSVQFVDAVFDSWCAGLHTAYSDQ